MPQRKSKPKNEKKLRSRPEVRTVVKFEYPCAAGLTTLKLLRDSGGFEYYQLSRGSGCATVSYAALRELLAWTASRDKDTLRMLADVVHKALELRR